jgi:hypothetical protein
MEPMDKCRVCGCKGCLPKVCLNQDLPDEMFEDMLHQSVRNQSKTDEILKSFYKEANREFFFSEKLARQIYDLEGLESLRRKAPITVDCDKLVAMWFPPVPIDPGEFDDDDPTDPIIKPLSEQLRLQRKKDGVCPECGDVKNESAVGICSLHGKFMG